MMASCFQGLKASVRRSRAARAWVQGPSFAASGLGGFNFLGFWVEVLGFRARGSDALGFKF